ncbi:hypothetical protein [Microcoleus sp.]|uniref:hypothetical protein n=1 Tax=Microcoleus sp. TaxID=44472 RepID=UPI00403EBC62
MNEPVEPQATRPTYLPIFLPQTGQRQSVKYDLMLERSIGLGIDDGVRLHAARICDIQRQEMAVEF